ncbi:type II secretion system F family protein [Haloechinothrix sp. LS1_15]|uniref:type II secretion system F family protein n=1 Tax=Haloechinothrix sp. LS1_15 TaxID=2652248 RepID=UPI0029482D60|nr:type II secretion system F family protein [Haloechinothrix sp. LS1_15]MDV6011359.1 hypothetical protein [Haloechinothrix sp. LS1_15]
MTAPTMLVVSLLGLGVASLPIRRAPARLRRCTGGTRRRAPSPLTTFPPPAVVRHLPGWRAGAVLTGAVLAVLAGFAWLGPAGAAVFGMATLLTWRMAWERRRERARLATARRGAAALRTLVGRLRAGVHPATAVFDAAEDAGGQDTPEGSALHAMAAHTRLGGEAGTVVPGAANGDGAASRPLLRIARAWSLAERSGVPLAEALDAVRGDLEAAARLAGQRSARMAGPRASVLVLVALPVLGIALGELMGAGPVAVLAMTGHGQVLLLLGGVLLCAGTMWSARLTRQDVPV